MQTYEQSSKKRIVKQLFFGQKTAKRVTWEGWEFQVIGPQQIEVTNASYGCEKAEHQYIVIVEDRNGIFVPDKCECPADQYNDNYACKHRVAVATVGGSIVIGAAMAYTSDKSSQSEPTTTADKIGTDGGTDITPDTADHVAGDSDAVDRPDDCDCASFITDHGLPCWACYRDGFETLNPHATEDDE